MKEVLVTLFLFTQSDLKTTFFPVMLFAATSSDPPKIYSIARASIWVYLHLLQFCVSNQLIGEAEDLKNKPWRPITAGRISRSKARILRWVLAVACLFLSHLFSVVRPSVLLTIGILMSSELGFDAHWFGKNATNALGYYSFQAGACTIVSGKHGVLGDPISEAIFRGALIVLTTIHAQDFQDVPGDRIQGRKTLPIVAPTASRISMILLLMWSMWLGAISQTAVAQGFLILAAIVVGGRFMLFRTVHADHISYILYNVWLSSAQFQLFHRA
ncbi:UbiA prenyltransferase family [Armillaria fumosa]|nr:UbiA prenyltransferase family [Armillaria fumosa]